MTEPVNGSVELANDRAADDAASLLHHYSFDLGDYTLDQLFSYWQEHYPVNWIRLATIEALYQGRYKAISVEQILALWRRRSHPLYHFNHEFERLVCDNLPPIRLAAAAAALESEPALLEVAADSRLPYHSVALQLPSFKSAAAHLDPNASTALKTLSSFPEADSAAPPDPVTPSKEPPAGQTYSYNLRSDAQWPYSSTYPSHPAVTTTDLDSAIATTALESEPSDVAETAPLDPPDPDSQLNADLTGREIPTSEIPTVDRAETDPSSDVSSDLAALDRSFDPATAPTGPQAEMIARILQQLDDQELSARAVLPGFGLMAHTLRPKLRLHLTTRYQPSWLTDASSKQPIHQFTPDPESSDFHSKLKAVAQPHPDAAMENPARSDDA